MFKNQLFHKTQIEAIAKPRIAAVLTAPPPGLGCYLSQPAAHPTAGKAPQKQQQYCADITSLHKLDTCNAEDTICVFCCEPLSSEHPNPSVSQAVKVINAATRTEGILKWGDTHFSD